MPTQHHYISNTLAKKHNTTAIATATQQQCKHQSTKNKPIHCLKQGIIILRSFQRNPKTNFDETPKPISEKPLNLQPISNKSLNQFHRNA